MAGTASLMVPNYSLPENSTEDDKALLHSQKGYFNVQGQEKTNPAKEQYVSSSLKNLMEYRDAGAAPASPSASSVTTSLDNLGSPPSSESPQAEVDNERLTNEFLDEICEDMGIRDGMDFDFLDFMMDTESHTLIAQQGDATYTDSCLNSGQSTPRSSGNSQATFNTGVVTKDCTPTPTVSGSVAITRESSTTTSPVSKRFHMSTSGQASPVKTVQTQDTTGYPFKVPTTPHWSAMPNLDSDGVSSTPTTPQKCFPPQQNDSSSQRSQEFGSPCMPLGNMQQKQCTQSVANLHKAQQHSKWSNLPACAQRSDIKTESVDSLLNANKPSGNLSQSGKLQHYGRSVESPSDHGYFSGDAASIRSFASSGSSAGTALSSETLSGKPMAFQRQACLNGSLRTNTMSPVKDQMKMFGASLTEQQKLKRRCYASMAECSKGGLPYQKPTLVNRNAYPHKSCNFSLDNEQKPIQSKILPRLNHGVKSGIAPYTVPNTGQFDYGEDHDKSLPSPITSMPNFEYPQQQQQNDLSNMCKVEPALNSSIPRSNNNSTLSPLVAGQCTNPSGMPPGGACLGSNGPMNASDPYGASRQCRMSGAGGMMPTQQQQFNQGMGRMPPQSPTMQLDYASPHTSMYNNNTQASMHPQSIQNSGMQQANMNGNMMVSNNNPTTRMPNMAACSQITNQNSAGGMQPPRQNYPPGGASGMQQQMWQGSQQAPIQQHMQQQAGMPAPGVQSRMGVPIQQQGMLPMACPHPQPCSQMNCPGFKQGSPQRPRMLSSQQSFIQHLITDRSNAFRSHPLFPLLRDLIIADMNFNSTSFPYQLISNLPAEFDKLLQNFLQRNPPNGNYQSNPAVESVIMDALKYAHQCLIEKIRSKQDQEKHSKSTSKSLSAIEEFCEKFDRSVRNSVPGTPSNSHHGNPNVMDPMGLQQPGVPQMLSGTSTPLGGTPTKHPKFNMEMPSPFMSPMRKGMMMSSITSSPQFKSMRDPSDILSDCGGSVGCNKSESKKHPSLPKEAVAMMLDWLRNHKDNPYPNDDEKAMLIKQTGLTINQINYWFTNARRRILPKWAQCK